MREANAPSQDALIAQLKELNERSRTYGRQFWQVPFAYVAGAAVALAQLAEKPVARIVALALIFVIGCFTILHLAFIYRAAHRAFCAMVEVEKRLDLSPDATKWTPGHLWAFLGLTILASAGSLVAAVYLFACRSR